MAADKKKGAAPSKKGKKFSRYKLYTVEGDSVKRKNLSCPKCGSASMLAAHKDRHTCGKCGYVEKK